MLIRIRRRSFPAAAVAAVLAIAMPSAAASGVTSNSVQALGTPRWRAARILSVQRARTLVLGVSAPGPRDAWAVATSEPLHSGRLTPLVEHWNGSAWSPVSIPAAVVAKLGVRLMTTVTATKPDGMWAFTVFGQWLHHDGAAWAAGPLPARSGTRPDVQASVAVGKNTIWAFGGAPGRADILAPYAAFHAGRAGWKRTPVPGKGMISAASAVSGRDIWAVIGIGVLGTGLTSARHSGIVHWHDGRWRAAGGPAGLVNGSLGAVLARSDHDVWVGGAVKNSRGGTTEAIGHWNGTRWSVQALTAPASKAPFRVDGLIGDGSGGIWALGDCVTGPCSGLATGDRLWHETGGKWSGPVRPVLAGHAAILVSLARVHRSLWAGGFVRAGRRGADGLIAVLGATPR